MQDDILIEKPPKALPIKETMNYFRGNSQYTREDIIKGNMRLVLSIVSSYNVSIEDKKDFFQIGMIGLMKAIDSFDISKGFKFATYAGRCINNEILMQIRKMKKDQNVFSYEDALFTDNDTDELRIFDTLVDNSVNIAEDYENKEVINLLKQLVVSLDSRDTLVLTLYFGLFGSDRLLQEEIAFRLNLSRSYVSRLINNSLRTLKELLENLPQKCHLRGKKPGSIFKLLKGYDRKLIYEVINDLSEEDRILMYLRCGNNLDKPKVSPFWNKNTAVKFNTKLLPKIKRELETREWMKKHTEYVEELSPMEIYRREKLDEIHKLLLSMDMVNAQVVLHEYLVDNNLIQYETYIVSLIILSVMDKDFSFTIPIRSLVLLFKEYKFNGEKYKEYFYESLLNDIAQAPLYLDIVKCLYKDGMSDISFEPLEYAYTRALNLKK